MKSFALAALSATPFITAAGALSLQQRSDGPARVLHFETERNVVADPVSRDQRRRRKRDTTLNVPLSNEKSLYSLTASIGTPGQDVRLHLDTGSSDLWVNVADSTFCQRNSDECSSGGTFDTSASSTLEVVNQDFNISYADGSGAAGDYVTDTVKIQGQTIKNLQFGIGLESSTPDNILGIGYIVNEAIESIAGTEPYNNLNAKLAADGTIASNAYSLWLNDLDASKGSVLFGGVDRDKYDGDLVTVPIQQIAGSYYEFFITMTGFKMGSKTLGSDMALGVLLDSGSTLTYLPNSMVSTIYKQLDATYDSQSGTAYVPCDMANQDLDMVFSFSSPSEITVPMNELVIDLSAQQGGNLQFNDGTDACLFGIAPSGSSVHVLGDTFLRSAYVVYDLDNNEISLAQTKYNVSSSDIVEIGTGSSAVPGATDTTDSVSAASGLPDQGEQGAGDDGNIDPSPTDIFGGSGDDDEDAAGNMSPPAGLAIFTATFMVLIGGLLL